MGANALQVVCFRTPKVQEGGAPPRANSTFAIEDGCGQALLMRPATLMRMQASEGPQRARLQAMYQDWLAEVGLQCPEKGSDYIHMMPSACVYM